MTTSTSSGAVFFLGNRAHYQVLTSSEPNHDQENGNSETIYQNTAVLQPNKNYWTDNSRKSDSSFLKMAENGGIKRRFLKSRKQDGSSELILGERDDLNPTGLNEIDNGNKQVKNSKRSRISVIQLLSSLTRRRNKKKKENYNDNSAIICTYRNSCRCYDCQSRYFECDRIDDDDEDEDEISIQQPVEQYYPEQQPLPEGAPTCMECGEYANYCTYALAQQQLQQHAVDGADDGLEYSTEIEAHDAVEEVASPDQEMEVTENAEMISDVTSDEPTLTTEVNGDLDVGDDEVFLTSPAPVIEEPQPQIIVNITPQTQEQSEQEKEALMLELAAGAPLFFDILLNHPFTCSLQ